MTKINIQSLIKSYPLLNDLIALHEVSWFNPNATTCSKGFPLVGLTDKDVKDAQSRLARFASYFCHEFPETVATKGIIESPLVAIPTMQSALEKYYNITLAGKLLLKKDSHLPISGSVKARGGIYEVLHHAEQLAINAGLLTEHDDYSKLSAEDIKQFFKKYRITVGSTGNLGLAIGIISAKLGFKVTVHMSADARQWKKDKLRAHGVNVIEHIEDYSVAVAQAREEAQTDNHCYFVDDENSQTLFLGYSTVGKHLKQQLAQAGISVDKEHPLFVYLPCGVGGAPGGITFGLKLAFGDNVYCLFAEPTHSPCMLLGVHTGLHNKIAVQDLGIDNLTAADGLAVGRASGFIGPAMERLISGYYTVSDQTLYNLLGLLNRTENIQLEPSALAGMAGPQYVTTNSSWLTAQNITPQQLQQATHIVWATGGGMVPEDEMKNYLAAAQYP